MIKVLHTADWHLGKRLETAERTEEHGLFLDWLAQKLNSECIDVLVVAGDIFDTGSPTPKAITQYFDFLCRIRDTCCQSVIIVGGNHDSVHGLNAPKALLKNLDIHVVGGVPESIDEGIVVIEKNGTPELVVCAVPFLRDRDLRLSIAGESQDETTNRLIKGICDHYQKLADHVWPHRQKGIPILATGHLFAQGGVTRDSEEKIFVGNLAKIGGAQFPEAFDYIALGHLHRPQMVGDLPHIRYSGSPFPLSFSESEDEKMVLVLTFDKGRLAAVEEQAIPQARKFMRLEGSFEQVKMELKAIADPGMPLSAWIEVQILTLSGVWNAEEELEKIVGEKTFIERLFVRQLKSSTPQLDDGGSEMDLSLYDLSPKEVFRKRCLHEMSEEEYHELLPLFDLALELLDEEENGEEPRAGNVIALPAQASSLGKHFLPG